MNNWDDIRFFLSLARNGSLSKASRALGVNHSTVSRRIQSLQDLYNVTLFNKKTDGFVLTQVGKEILEYAENLERENYRIQRQLHANDESLDGKIKITMPEAIFNYGISTSLYHFKQDNPGIDLEISLSARQANLSAREADIAIRLTSSPPENLVGIKISQPRFGIYAKSGFVQTNRLAVVSWNNETTPPEWALKINPKAYISIKVNTVSAAHQAVRDGFGVALMPCLYVGCVNDNDVQLFTPSTLQFDKYLWALYHPDLRKSQRVRKCYRYLINEVKRISVEHGDITNDDPIL